MSLCLRRRLQIGRRELDRTTTSPLEQADLLDEEELGDYSLSCEQLYRQRRRRRAAAVTCRLAALCASLTDVLTLVMPTRGVSDLDKGQVDARRMDIEVSRRSLDSWAAQPGLDEPQGMRFEMEAYTNYSRPDYMGAYGSLLWILYRWVTKV